MQFKLLGNQDEKIFFLNRQDCAIRALSKLLNKSIIQIKKTFNNNDLISIDNINKKFNTNLIKLKTILVNEYYINFQTTRITLKHFNTICNLNGIEIIFLLFPSLFDKKIILNFNYSNEIKTYINNILAKSSDFHWIYVKDNHYYDTFDYSKLGINIDNWIINSIIIDSKDNIF